MAWEYIRPILLENGGWAAFDYTPRGKNHGYDLWNMASHNPDWYTSRLTVDDTRREDGQPVITPEMIESERREGVSEEIIQQEYYCSFEGVMEGAYYGRQMADAEADGRITRVPWEESIGVETWWDIGVGDSTAIWFTQSVGREVHVIDYMEASGESLSYYAKALQSRPYVYKAHHGPHDLQVREWASGGEDGRPRSRIEVAKSLGIDFHIVPNLSLDDGINAARSMIPRCWFDREKCKRGLDALSSYHKDYDSKLKVFRSYPAHDWSSHGSDAYRYLSVGHQTSKPKIPKRSGLESGQQTFMAN